MPDHQPKRRAPARLPLALIAALAVLAALPAATLAATGSQRPVDRITIADVPSGPGGEDCVDDPSKQPGVGLRECPKTFNLGSLLPFIAGGVVIVLAVAVGWFLVMRRRVSRPFLPDDAVAEGSDPGVRRAGAAGPTSGEWWTCRTCGKTNMVGSARCYSCGSWQR